MTSFGLGEADHVAGCMLAHMRYLDEWNVMTADEAAELVLPCCGSRAWAAGLAARRPLGSLPELLAASDSAWWSLGEKDWQEAFASHPRIGEREAVGTTDASLRWSALEQGAVLGDAGAVEAERLAAANRAYEERFGRVFLVRAEGRNAAEMLAILERRMHHTTAIELQESAEQQREITHGRLQRWLAEREARMGELAAANAASAGEGTGAA